MDRYRAMGRAADMLTGLYGNNPLNGPQREAFLAQYGFTNDRKEEIEKSGDAGDQWVDPNTGQRMGDEEEMSRMGIDRERRAQSIEALKAKLSEMAQAGNWDGEMENRLREMGVGDDFFGWATQMYNDAQAAWGNR